MYHKELKRLLINVYDFLDVANIVLSRAFVDILKMQRFQ